MGVSDIVTVLTANASQFNAEIDKAEAKIHKLSKNGASSMQKLGAAGKAAFLGLGAAAVGVGIYSVDMADKFENSHARLEQAFKNAGASTDAFKGQIDSLNSTFENYGYTNAQTEDALSRMVSGTGNVSLSLKSMGIAADLAKARNMDLNAATDLVTKTMGGNITAARRLGIAVPPEILKIKDPTEKANAVLAILSQRMGGQAAKSATTMGGKIAATRAHLSDMAQKIGMALIPIVDKLVTAFSKLIDYFEKHKTAAQALGFVVGVTLVAAFGLWAASIWATNTALLANPVTWIIVGIVALVAAIAILAIRWSHGWNQVKHDFDTVVKFLRSGFGSLVLLITGPIAPLLFLALHWQTVWGFIKSVALDAWNFLDTTLFQPLETIWQGIEDAANGIVAFFSGLGSALGTALSDVANAISAPFTTAFGAIKSLWNSTVGGFGFKIPGWVPVVGGDQFKIPNMAEGGLVKARPGGTIVRLAEAGVDELVTPMRGGRRGGGSQIVNYNSFSITSNDPQAVVNALVTWQQRNGSLPITVR